MVVPYQILNIITLKFSFLPFQIVILFSNVKHMKIFRFKFDKNHTKNEEFDFFESGGGGSDITISKF